MTANTSQSEQAGAPGRAENQAEKQTGDQPQPAEDTAVDLLEPAEGVPPLVEDAAALSDAAARLTAGSGPVAVDAERASGYRYSGGA